MLSGKKLIAIILPLIVISTICHTVKAKSAYVIADTGTETTDIPLIQAYDIIGSTLVLQKSYDSIYPHAIGIAINTNSEFMFITHEDYGQGGDLIEVVNTKTMQYVDTVTAPGATDLAGVAMDTGKSKLYAVDRYTNHLYSWSWDPATKILTPDFSAPYYIELEDLEWNGYSIGAFGIALDKDNGLLYVADNTDSIKYYNTTDWQKEGEINNLSCNVISVAIDVENQLLYYSSIGYPYGQDDTHLYQYDNITFIKFS